MSGTVRNGETKRLCQVEHELRRFYYDTAQAAHPAALGALLTLAPVSEVLFGRDFRYRTAAEQVAGLAAHGFAAGDRRAIERGNALGLVPRLAARTV